MSSLARIAAKADKMIRANGRTLTLTRTTAVNVSAAGTPTPGRPLTDSSAGVFLPLTSYTDNREEVNTLAQRQVRYLLVSAKGMTMEPRPQDTIAVGATQYRVESSTPINPNGAAIAHQTLVVQL